MPADVLQGAGSTREQEALERLARPGGVSIALYPAGREVGERAGIAAPITVLVAELHDARRHVDRICRAFGTGSCEVLLSLDDDRMRALLGGPVSRWAFRSRDGELSLGRSRWLVRHAQRSAERAGAMMRQEMMWRDRQLDDLLAFSGKFE